MKLFLSFFDLEYRNITNLRDLDTIFRGYYNIVKNSHLKLY